MSRNSLDAVTVAALLVLESDEEEDGPSRKRPWMHPYIARRQEQGYHFNLLSELALENPDIYRNVLRMDTETFANLVDIISPEITRSTTTMRLPLTPAERLEITLRYLATGESFKSLRYQFRVGTSTISGIIPEVCAAIYRKLAPDYLKCPQTAEEWRKISRAFHEKWQFPNCLGSIDGKHIRIVPPPSCGSYYYNYKKFNSIVLLAVADADLNFVYIDVGTNGRISDGGVWAKSSLKNALDEGRLDIPIPLPLPYDPQQNPMPFVFLGDAAFTLSVNLMRPYPNLNRSVSELIFDYRLSRARRVIENAFGVMSTRFGVYRVPIALHPKKVEEIVKATCVLHNYLRRKLATTYAPEAGLQRENTEQGRIVQGFLDGSGAGATVRLRLVGRNATQVAKDVQEKFRDYFLGPGAVEWQNRMIGIADKDTVA